MNRKSALLSCGMVLCLAAVAAVVIGLVRREPTFYQHIAVPEGPERTQQVMELMTQVGIIYDGITSGDPWSCRVTAEQINSYFAEDYGRDGVTSRILPAGIRDPRIEIDADKIRLAFRYGADPWSTVVSIDLRVWLAPKEPNVVALELQGMWAGSVPISAQSLLESIKDAVREQNIDPSPWYRHEGHPVTLLRFQADRPTPTIRLQRLELHAGEILISGCSNGNEPIPAALAPAATP